MNDDCIHYRLPLKTVNSLDWARIGGPGRAILPVIGVFANDDDIAWPGLGLLSELSGYAHRTGSWSVTAGIQALQEHGLLLKTRCGRRNRYELTNRATWYGHSYFPLYKRVIMAGQWANLTMAEKAVFGVLGCKGSIERARREAEDSFCIGYVFVWRYALLAGVSRMSFWRGLRGLQSKGWVFMDGEGGYQCFLEPT